MLMVTKWLYPEVAGHYNTNWQNVERNIRTVTVKVWQDHRERLEEIARGRLPVRPTASRFLAILVQAVINNRAA